MSRNRVLALLSLLLITSLLLGACGPTTAPATEAPAEEATEAPAEEEPTEEAAPATDRKGGWLDEVVMSTVSADTAVTQLVANALDIYAGNLATPETLQPVADAGLNRSVQFGLFYEITTNPAEFADGRFNPFAYEGVRRALNWLIDRNYIVQEIYGGNAVPKWFPLVSGFPDYAKYVDVARPLEAEYGYDLERARAEITATMEENGAVLDGVWTFNGEPVNVEFLIRTDSDGTRVPVGDYVSSQLEEVGFQVTRHYGTSSELSPFWIQGDPYLGEWNLYTGAWLATAVSRNDGPSYHQYYSPDSVMGAPLWQSYADDIDPAFPPVLDTLNNSSYTNEEERREAFASAMQMQFDNNFRVWLVDGQGGSPWNTNVETSYDLAAGVATSPLTAYTIRFLGEEGGTLRWADTDIFVEPANPIGGSNWAFDAMWQNFTQDVGLHSNPHTGIALPQRIERAEVTATTGLPISSTYDWATLTFEDAITIPDDAWIDWDAAAQNFITVADAGRSGETALIKSVAYYPAELYTTSWHDGSAFSAADVVMNMIMVFAPGTEGDPLYDESAAGNLAGFKAAFKGFKIASTDPLVVEFYTDGWQPDAENNVFTLYPTNTGGYAFGTGAWHNIGVANMAEAEQTLAYAVGKADALGVEWTNLVAGPSLEILSGYLDQATAEGTIPFPNVLSAYITADEASARYANLAAFYADHGHFWIGTGPYILDQVLSTEKQAVLVHNPNHIDPSDKWSGFGEPKLATVEIDGSARVGIGEEATFDVFVTFGGEAYPADEISSAKYLLYDATGALVEVGDATLAEDGHYTVTLSAETTGALAAGANTLEIAVAPIPASVPSFATFEFVTE
jgi:peptide/nickel transport system substrate-binding protein